MSRRIERGQAEPLHRYAGGFVRNLAVLFWPQTSSYGERVRLHAEVGEPREGIVEVELVNGTTRLVAWSSLFCDRRRA